MSQNSIGNSIPPARGWMRTWMRWGWSGVGKGPRISPRAGASWCRGPQVLSSAQGPVVACSALWMQKRASPQMTSVQKLWNSVRSWAARPPRSQKSSAAKTRPSMPPSRKGSLLSMRELCPMPRKSRSGSCWRRTSPSLVESLVSGGVSGLCLCPLPGY